MIADGGFWMFPVLGVGIIAALVAAINIAKKQDHFANLAKYLALAALFLGLAGTAMGLYQGGIAIGGMPADKATNALMMNAIGISFAPMFAGAALAGLSGLLLGVGAWTKGNG